MARYRTFNVTFKRQVAQEFLTGESLNSVSRKYDIARNLIRIWVLKHEGGEFEHDTRLKAHEVKIAGLERMVGKLTMELEFLRGVSKTPTSHSRDPTPDPPSLHEPSAG
jgi:transposase-like protein